MPRQLQKNPLRTWMGGWGWYPLTGAHEKLAPVIGGIILGQVMLA